MPGIVLFRRRWTVGSDDMVVAAVCLALLHLLWIIILTIVAGVLITSKENFSVHPPSILGNLTGYSPSTSDHHLPIISTNANKSGSDSGAYLESPPNSPPNSPIQSPPPSFQSTTVKVPGNIAARVKCASELRIQTTVYIIVLVICVIIEAIIGRVSMRGTILEDKERATIVYWLYIRLVILIVEVALLLRHLWWFAVSYQNCPSNIAKGAVLGVVICNWMIVLFVIFVIWCTFDKAGRLVATHEDRNGCNGSAKGKELQRRKSYSRPKTDAQMMYHKGWEGRFGCYSYICCISKQRHRATLDEVSRLFSDYFRDLDIVPSDVVAGLMLLGQRQRKDRTEICTKNNNGIYAFLSGAAITTTTEFLGRHKDNDKLKLYKETLHYIRYSAAAYGWPMLALLHKKSCCCKLLPALRCNCCSCCERQYVIDDNCCRCNFAAMQKMSQLDQNDFYYSNMHVDVGETVFFIAFDHFKKDVVVSIRGTLSFSDVLTDLNGDAGVLPVDPVHPNWLAHKGMIQAAIYVRDMLHHDNLLKNAFIKAKNTSSVDYQLVLVGHSLGAGTAAILAILLHNEYPTLKCFSYAPPGGLLSEECVEETKHYITSIIVGKDIIPRMGLYQMGVLRNDLLKDLKSCKLPKWRIIGNAVCCLPTSIDDDQEEGNSSIYSSGVHDDTVLSQPGDLADDLHDDPDADASSTAPPLDRPTTPYANDTPTIQRAEAGLLFSTPATPATHSTPATPAKPATPATQAQEGEEQSTLCQRTVNNPSSFHRLYIPGTVIHVVRNHPPNNTKKHRCKRKEPLHQAIFANNKDFGEILISPTMLSDHLIPQMIHAMNMVLTQSSPDKPTRTMATAYSQNGGPNTTPVIKKRVEPQDQPVLTDKINNLAPLASMETLAFSDIPDVECAVNYSTNRSRKENNDAKLAGESSNVDEISQPLLNGFGVWAANNDIL